MHMTDSDEIMKYAIQYITENLQKIALDDIEQILLRGQYLSWPTQDIIKEIVKKFLHKRKEKIGQKSIQTSSDKENQIISLE